MFLGLFDIIFEFSEVELFWLEVICDIIFFLGLLQLVYLQEFSLFYLFIRLFFFLQVFLWDYLKVMCVKCEEFCEVLFWVFGLWGLEELYLEGFFFQELVWVVILESFWELKQFKVLFFWSNVGKVLVSVIDVVGYLQRFSLYNDGVCLVVLNSFKKLVVLWELELVVCGLECIFYVVFSLGVLQEFDFKDNYLCFIEEIFSFQYCWKLVMFRLWYNQIVYVFEYVWKFRSLEQFYLSYNKLEILFFQFGLCLGFCLLDVFYNGLYFLLFEVGFLQNLQYLVFFCNVLEVLFDEFFFCCKFWILFLGDNQLSQFLFYVGVFRVFSCLEFKGNCFEVLLEEFGNCGGLKKVGFLVEDIFYQGLLVEVWDKMEEE